MSRQDIFGHRYYQPGDGGIPECDVEETKTVSIVPHNGTYLAECMDRYGDITFYLEKWDHDAIVSLVHHLFDGRADVKIDEGG